MSFQTSYFILDLVLIYMQNDCVSGQNAEVSLFKSELFVFCFVQKLCPVRIELKEKLLTSQGRVGAD